MKFNNHVFDLDILQNNVDNLQNSLDKALFAILFTNLLKQFPYIRDNVTKLFNNLFTSKTNGKNTFFRNNV